MVLNENDYSNLYKGGIFLKKLKLPPRFVMLRDFQNHESRFTILRFRKNCAIEEEDGKT